MKSPSPRAQQQQRQQQPVPSPSREQAERLMESTDRLLHSSLEAAAKQAEAAAKQVALSRRAEQEAQKRQAEAERRVVEVEAHVHSALEVHSRHRDEGLAALRGEYEALQGQVRHLHAQVQRRDEQRETRGATTTKRSRRCGAARGASRSAAHAERCERAADDRGVAGALGSALRVVPPRVLRVVAAWRPIRVQARAGFAQLCRGVEASAHARGGAGGGGRR